MRTPDAWRRFGALTVGDRLLVAEAAALLSLVRVGLSIVAFPTLRRLLNFYAGERGGGLALSNEPAPGVVWAVGAVARRLPGRTTCLVEALAADAMLRRRGCASELRFGVRPPGNGSKPLEAHAWIEYQGMILIGKVENLADYAVLSASRSS